MKKQSITQKDEYFNGLVENTPSVVHIPGTKRKVKVSGIKPYTMEQLTKLWIERDLAAVKVEDGSDVLKDLAKEPYFAVKEACLIALNGYWGIRLLYPIKWRIWAYWKGYTDEQMLPIIAEGKKKLPLSAHWIIMASSMDMRTDMMMMTKKEAEQYRAELLLAEKQRLSKTSQNTEGQGVSFLG